MLEWVQRGRWLAQGPLAEEEVDQFIEHGFVHLQEVAPAEVVAEGQRVIWSDLSKSPDDPSSWTEPVVTMLPSNPRPFAVAFDNPRLHGALDQLVGVGRWQPRNHLGVFIVRFPHATDPGDTGWHVDESLPLESYSKETHDFGQWRVNVFSGDRALLALFLFSDIGPDDGPTRIRIGSHLDVPPLLQPAGTAGLSFSQATALAVKASGARPVTLATGKAGDVYLCHPFLVHGAQPVRGRNVRLMSRTPITSTEPVVLDQPAEADSPVEAAIRRALATPRAYDRPEVRVRGRSD